MKFRSPPFPARSPPKCMQNLKNSINVGMPFPAVPRSCLAKMLVTPRNPINFEIPFPAVPRSQGRSAKSAGSRFSSSAPPSPSQLWFSEPTRLSLWERSWRARDASKGSQNARNPTICVYQRALLSVLSPGEMLVKPMEFHRFCKSVPVRSPFRSPPKSKIVISP